MYNALKMPATKELKNFLGGAHKTTSGQIFNPKFENPMGCFLFDYEF